jgi:dTDP-4-dehydrorhamnose 3,5-epimerase
MKFCETELPGLIKIKPLYFDDNRGYFFESFNQRKLEEYLNFKVNFCQDNESMSKKNVLRGLHFQIEPFAQSKLIRVIHGSVLDVVLDLRSNSPTFGKHQSFLISKKNGHQLFIPKGFAHGFVSLEDNTIFSYKVDNYYNIKSESGIRYNDSHLSIDWEIEKDKLIISEKDQNLPSFAFDKQYFNI